MKYVSLVSRLGPAAQRQVAEKTVAETVRRQRRNIIREATNKIFDPANGIPRSFEPVTFSVSGQPVGKGRPRFVKATGHTYTPEKTREYEDAVKYAAREAMGNKPPTAAAVSMSVHAVFRIPESWPKVKRQAALDGALRPTSAPDADNVAKAASDGMNGIVYLDDSQIVHVEIDKIYGPIPHLTINVRPA